VAIEVASTGAGELSSIPWCDGSAEALSRPGGADHAYEVAAKKEALMSIGHDIAVKVGKALESVHAGTDNLAARKLSIVGRVPGITLTSSDFVQDGPLPQNATVDGAGVPPTLSWNGIPSGARSLVLIAEDPDAPYPEPYVHWLVYGIAPDVTAIGGASGRQDGASGHEGQNSKLKSEFTPAAPPPGHGVHHYHFQLFALDYVPDLGKGVGRQLLLDAMALHVIAFGELVGTYQRT
jgi:Raf kinase inhibitor-like YbhB/YbcL family protein